MNYPKNIGELCKRLKSGDPVCYFEGPYLRPVPNGLTARDFLFLHDLFSEERVIILYQVRDPEIYSFKYYAVRKSYAMSALSFSKLLDNKRSRKPTREFDKGELIGLVRQIGGTDHAEIADEVIRIKGWRSTPSLRKKIVGKVYFALWNQNRTDRR